MYTFNVKIQVDDMSRRKAALPALVWFQVAVICQMFFQIVMFIKTLLTNWAGIEVLPAHPVTIGLL